MNKNTTAAQPLDLDKLEALAKAATPGPWMRLFGERTIYDRMEDGCRGNAIVRADLAYSAKDAANLDFIAAANPATILALIAQARAAQPAGAADTTVSASGSIEDYAQFHTLLGSWISMRDYYQYDGAPQVAEAWRKFIDYIDSRATLAPVAAQQAAAKAPAAQAVDAPNLLNLEELAALRRFDECAQDGEGYDVPKEMMQRLAEIGVVRRKSGAYYEATDFGQHVLGNTPKAAHGDDACYRTARELALAIWRSDWADIAPQFEPLDDLMGVLSQIDNMVSGMSRRAASPASTREASQQAAAVAAPSDEQDSGAAMHDVVFMLREYAANPGYSHNDYADTMREAANCIEMLRARFWNSDHLAAPAPAVAAPTSGDARPLILLKAAHDLLKKQRESGYVLNLLSETVFYDDAECDGGCLMEDIGYVLDDAMRATQQEGGNG